jgi:hypothetical protein
MQLVKVYAKIKCVSRDTPVSPARYQVEYVFLTGAKRSDAVALVPATPGSESSLLYKIKALLIAHLNAAYAPETFSSGNVMLFGG